jgi:hypothetical protein
MLFFPELLPDELFYSCCARYHNESGNESSSQTLKDLFGVAHTEINCHFPSRLNNFVSTCNKKKWGISIESIIERHTIYPFFHPFLDKDQSENIIKMIEGTLKYRPHFILGIKNKFWTSVLNYCPDCIKEDDLKYGTLYWHRLHQIPGIVYCLDHNKRLINCCPCCGILLDTHNDFIVLRRHCQCGYDRIFDMPKKVISLEEYKNLSQLIDISRDIVWLMQKFAFVGQPGALRHNYKNYISKTDFISMTGRIKQNELVDAFLEHYSQSTLKLLQCDIPHNWLKHFFNKEMDVIHPVKHVLFIRFLFGSVHNYVQEFHEVA